MYPKPMVASKTASPADVVERSGHTLHSRVVKLLRREGWSVIVSPYYSDNFTDKPREIDIVAERAFDYNHPGRGLYGDVVIQLFIECKYIASTTVVWFDDKDIERAGQRVLEDTGWSEAIHPNKQKHHHLSKGGVAKLFSSSASRTEDGEAIARAINQNLNALIYYRSRNPVSRQIEGRKTFRRLSYPIIVVNSFGEMYRTNMADDSMSTTQIDCPFQLEVNYAYKLPDGGSRSEFFLIDVVSLDGLGGFLKALEEADVGAMMWSLNWVQ